MRKHDCFDEVFTLSEAEKKYGLTKRRISKDISRGKFKESEIKKSDKRTWLIKRSAVERVYRYNNGCEEKGG